MSSGRVAIAILIGVTNIAVAQQDEVRKPRIEKATFGAGCFWCVEAVFERIPGVQSVVAGYAGGTKEDPTDKEMYSGTTGHAEVVQITYDADSVSFEKLLDVFWKSHDPTTSNRQGGDVGPQYRSVILYAGDEQKTIAQRSKEAAQQYHKDAIVTEIEPLNEFYVAKRYHQDYYKNNPNAPYCTFVIKPKLRKLGLEH